MKEHKLKLYNIKMMMIWESMTNLRKKKQRGDILDEERIPLRELEESYLSMQRKFNTLKRGWNNG